MKTAQLTLLEASEEQLSNSKSAVSLGRYSNLDTEKLRGGYYTPENVASWIAKWAVRDGHESVLEPSCGDGVFLEAIASRINSLGKNLKIGSWQLVGVEVVKEEAEKSKARVDKCLGKCSTAVSVMPQDFFSWWSTSRQKSVDVVVGNPPFIRYQSFPESSRERAMEIMRTLGLRPNRLTNIWVPFVVASVALLKPGGRLGMVIPAELLQVSYASQLRSFLTDRFRRIDIIACNDLLFVNAEQEIVLLLADDLVDAPSEQNICRVALTEIGSVDQLMKSEPAKLLAKSQRKQIRHDSEKWLKYFLSNREIELMRRLREADEVTVLASHASVDVGVVTGRNDFFLLSAEQVAQYGVNRYVTPVVGRSAQIRGVRFTDTDWAALATRGERVHLLNLGLINGHSLPKECLGYIKAAEAASIHQGYKCSIRVPWYVVPSIWSPDCFFFRQIYDFPRAIINRAGATSTDTIHRMKCRTKPELVVKSLYTSLTAASAEIEGRSYGGGVLELEPTEAERLLMPAQLHSGLPLDECDRLLRTNRLDALISENDRYILRQGIGLDRVDCKTLNGIWMKMRERRFSRRRRAS